MPWQDYLPSYRSVRFIEVKNWKLALVHILLQLAVILYVVVYSIVIKQSYQEYDPLVGTTAIKVKGSAQQNGTTNANGTLLYNGTVFDSYDLVIPPTEPNALFIATNVIRTFNQTRGVCPGNDKDRELCIADGKYNTGCIEGVHTYNGIMTGECANTTTNPNATHFNPNATHFCKLRTWCPLEYENKTDHEFMREHYIHGVEEWSIFARANIKFTKFNQSKTNAPNGVIKPGLNQWTLAELVSQTGFTFQDVQSLGAIILVTFSYECDLDHSIDECNPDIHFQRIDPTAPTPSDQPGFNFRYVDRYFDADGVERRALTKAYGVRILFQLIGKAGKFNIVPLLVALGSGLGLLSVATIVCDFVMQYLLPARRRYKREKIIDVPDEDPMSPRNQQQPHVQDGREPLLEASGSFAHGVGLQPQHGPRTFST